MYVVARLSRLQLEIARDDGPGCGQAGTVGGGAVQTCPLTKQKDKLSQTPTDFEDTNLVHICLVVIILTIISLICQESLSEDVKHLNLV